MSANDNTHEEHHVVPLRHYFGVFFALIALTFATVWTAKMDLGVFNTLVALTIATVKALLVVLIFMHVKYSNKLVQTMVGASVLWLLIMFLFTWSDFATRGWLFH
jgi:cytochrome c oxidase subunit 4